MKKRLPRTIGKSLCLTKINLLGTRTRENRASAGTDTFMILFTIILCRLCGSDLLSVYLWLLWTGSLQF